MIETNNLTKHFKVHKKEPGLKGSVKGLFHRQWITKPALEDISLKIEAGEIVGLVGSNGAGKTTLIKLLSGIIHPTSGSASVLGFKPWQRKMEMRRKIALIMGQKAQLWWDLPAADCFLLLREIYDIPEQAFQERLNDFASRLNVDEQLNIQVRKLSLGERMKMELIASLLHQPSVVFLDEPTIGLDLPSQRAIREFLLEYREEYNPAILLTSHYMEDIETVCERIVILSAGRMIYDGPLKEISAKYSRHKLIRAQSIDELSDEQLSSLESQLGVEVTRETGVHFSLKAKRKDIPRITTTLLSEFSLEDFSVEEDDVAGLIEEIMKEGRVA